MIPSFLRFPIASLVFIVVLGRSFGDDGLIFVTDLQDLIGWAAMWFGMGFVALFFALSMSEQGGSLNLTEK